MSNELTRPNLMPISVLTAALQNLVPRERFLEDPIGAAMDCALGWIAMAKRLGIDLQLSAALAIQDMYLPLEAMLDPVASHLAVRTKVTGEGEDLSPENAAAIIEACGNEVRIHDLAFCENLLHHDPRSASSFTSICSVSRVPLWR